MQIVVITPGFPPTLGGVETHVHALASRLPALGHRVEVWTPDRGITIPSVDMVNDMVIRRFPSTSSVRFSVSLRLHAFARKGFADADVVHAHSYHGLAASALLLAPPQTATVLTPHYHGGGHTVLARGAHLPYRRVGLAMMRRSDAVLAVSQAERDLIAQDFPYITDRLSVLANAADTTAIATAKPIPDQPPTVLVAGRLERYKHVERVISAFAQCNALDSQLVIIGDGPDRPRLESQAASVVANIRFLGRVDNDTLRSWQRTSRVVVNLSEHEAFGLVAIEGAAAGAFVVLSDIPAHREVREMLPPGVVTLCPPANLTATLMKLLASPPGRPRSVRSWDEATRELESIYAALPRRGTLRDRG